MEKLDSYTILEILKKLPAKDILNLCLSNKKLNQTCKKYSDIIWTAKLKEVFNVDKEDIIGKPISYFFGLLDHKKLYYFYDDWNFDIDGLRIKPISKEDAKYDNHFSIPGIEYPKDEDVYVVYFSFSLKRYGESFQIIMAGKRKEQLLQKLIEKIEYKYWDDFPYKDTVLSLSEGKKVTFKSVYYGGMGGDIPLDAKVQLALFHVTL